MLYSEKSANSPRCKCNLFVSVFYYNNTILCKFSSRILRVNEMNAFAGSKTCCGSSYSRPEASQSIMLILVRHRYNFEFFNSVKKIVLFLIVSMLLNRSGVPSQHQQFFILMLRKILWFWGALISRGRD